MKTHTWHSCAPILSASILASLVLSSTLYAQGQRGGRGGAGIAGMIAGAADVDRSGDVSAAEWQVFTAKFTTTDGSGIDKDVFKAHLFLPTLDRDRDGQFTRVDLSGLLLALDEDGNGELASDEFASRRGGQLASVVLIAADKDGNGRLSKDEWTGFVMGAATEGERVTVPVITSWFEKARNSKIGEARTQFTPGVYLLTLDSQLDIDGNGRFDFADLAKVFADLDADGDGALKSGEMRLRRARGNRGGRGGGMSTWSTVTDRSRPPLIDWQRSLDDALALSKQTGKPLLLCVNMDGESACENLAWGRYRDAEFAKLTRGFIPLVASPDRRNARDYDDRGRRVLDQRFGRVINAEHIGIEPKLFEKYFGGQRVAPRHVGVSPDGKILFDIYLTNDFGVIDRSLQQHGKFGGDVDLASMTTEQLVASRNALCRERLETMFTTGDEAVRVGLVRLALAKGRKAQQSQLLRMALMDENQSVLRAAVEVVIANTAEAESEFLAPAFRAARGDRDLTSRLCKAYFAEAERSSDEARQKRLVRLARVFDGLASSSSAVSVEAWSRALASGTVEQARPVSIEERDALDTLLEGLDAEKAKAPEDKSIDAKIAEASMRYVKVLMLEGQDPAFVLEDLQRAAQVASGKRAKGILAWANYYRNEQEKASDLSRESLPDLVESAGSAFSAEMLEIFAKTHSKRLFDALTAGSEWPSHWLADVDAAYRVLAIHPHGTAAQVAAHAAFLEGVEDWWTQGQVLRRGVERFSSDNTLHESLRRQLLNDRGARGLEAAYESMEIAESARASFEWFSGFASLVAAERHIQNLDPAASVESYSRSVAAFDRSVAANAAFKASCDYYAAMALVGKAKQLGALKRWDSAVEQLLSGLDRNPQGRETKDGLGNTPLSVAKQIKRAVRRAKAEQLDALVTGLRERGLQ